jgi:hypothetical protein
MIITPYKTSELFPIDLMWKWVYPFGADVAIWNHLENNTKTNMFNAKMSENITYTRPISI